MKSPFLLIKEISDLYVRKNFQLLQDYFDGQNQLLDFKFLDYSTDKAVTNQKIAHGLGYAPKDLIRTRKTGSGTITFNRQLFDAENIDITTSGPVHVRFFTGTYRDDNNRTNADDTDTETWT